MANVEITTTGTTVTVRSEYHPDWAPRARKLGGTWNGTTKTWMFDARDESRVRDLARDIYGTDGTDTAASETVTARINVDDVREITRYTTQNWHMFGRRIARRPYRDSTVTLGEKVVIISGGFPSSGGSMRNPDLAPVQGTVIEVRDIPAGHPDLTKPGVTIVDTQIDYDALRAEHAALSARLAQIETLLHDQK